MSRLTHPSQLPNSCTQYIMYNICTLVFFCSKIMQLLLLQQPFWPTFTLTVEKINRKKRSVKSGWQLQLHWFPTISFIHTATILMYQIDISGLYRCSWSHNLESNLSVNLPADVLFSATVVNSENSVVLRISWGALPPPKNNAITFWFTIIRNNIASNLIQNNFMWMHCLVECTSTVHLQQSRHNYVIRYVHSPTTSN